ncbi:MAG: ribosomal-processing cysteine protease Prp [Clostridia bacterium]|nr:ribosomal-processing cysteine protease Prp [Clostridia bacterium]
MTEVRYLFENDILVGFHLKGHSTASAEDDIGRLVCASISSAAYMAANTVTEIVGAQAVAEVNEEAGEMLLEVKSDFEEALPILLGFELHMEQLSEQFTDYIRIISEV